MNSYLQSYARAINPTGVMTPEDRRLVLTVARVLRRSLMAQAYSQTNTAWIADLRKLNEALRPFEPASADLEDGSVL